MTYEAETPYNAYRAVGPKLIASGYCAIPIAPDTKAPGDFVGGRWVRMSGWTERFRDALPNGETALWAGAPGSPGVGVVLGRASRGLVAIDIDAYDEEIVQAIIKTLPSTPLRKRGKKGATLFYSSGGLRSRALDFCAPDGAIVRMIDVLAEGRQTVLPPTIHPETRKPYEWIGEKTLLEVAIDDIPTIVEADVDRAIAAVEALGYRRRVAHKAEQAAPANEDANENAPWARLNAHCMKHLSAWVPQLDLLGCRPHKQGYEAVARWRFPDKGAGLEIKDRNLKIEAKGIVDFGDGSRGYSPIALTICSGKAADWREAYAWLSERTGWAEPLSAENADPAAIDAVLRAAKDDPKSLYTEENIALLAQIRQADSLAYDKLKIDLSAMRVKITNLDQAVRRAARRRSEAREANGRCQLRLTGDLSGDADRAVSALRSAEIYQRAGRLVRRSSARGKDHEGRVVETDGIQEFDVAAIRDAMSRCAVFQRPTEDGLTAVYPSADLASVVLSRTAHPFPILRGIINTPTLRHDGSVLDAAGHDEPTGLYYNPRGADFGIIPPAPAQDEARAALDKLRKPIAEFPFVDEPSRSVALALMLTGLVRPSLPSSPLFGMTAPAPRTGKSLLVDIATVIAHGKRASVVAATSNPDELDKQLQALLSSGASYIALDNIDPDNPVASTLLNQILTQPEVTVRPFGQAENKRTYPSIAVISVTGNNLAVVKDLTERTLLCRLDAKCEVPGVRRFDFDPVDVAVHDRVALVRACLTIMRAYVVAGRPDQNLAPMGGFEKWSDIVRSALVWLGCADPCETMVKVREGDVNRGGHGELMRLWHDAFGDRALRLGAAVRAAETRKFPNDPRERSDHALYDALWSIAPKGTRSLESFLGKWLRTKESTIIGGRMFVSGKHLVHDVWSVETVAEPQKPSQGDFF